MTENSDIFGTGRMLSPIKSPDGSAAVIYRDEEVTVWLYQTGAVSIQCSRQISDAAHTKARVKKALQSAIRESQQRIERAKKAIANNERDVSAYSKAVFELEKMWPDEESWGDE